MVKKIIPATQQQYDEWKAALASTKGVKVPDINPQFLYRLRDHYYVEDGKLMSKKAQKEVIILENLPGLLKKHHDEKCHPGRDATNAYLLELYAGIPYAEVEKYVAECTICQVKQTIAKAPVGKPIKVTGVLQQVGIDLIDMSSRSDGDYNWIFHAKDHLTKFTYAVPLKTKRCEEVAEAIRTMFYNYGPPQVLQHDQGREFTGKKL